MNRKLFSKLIQILPYIFFGLFTYLISYKLLGGIVSIGDFPFRWPASNFDSFSTWSTAYMGFSKANTMFGSQFFSLIPLALLKAGFSAENISYLSNFGPIYICSLTYYYLAKKLSSNIFLSYFSGLFIILNNFVLEHLLVFPGVIFYSFIIYGITLLFCYKIYFSGINYRRIIFIIFISFFHFHAFYFVINVLFLFLFSIFYSILHTREFFEKKIFLHFIVLFLGIFFIQFYWLAPFISNIFISSSSEVYGAGNQLAVFTGYLKNISYIKLQSLYHYPGNLGEKMHGSILQYFFYFYTIFLASLLFIFHKSRKNFWIIFLFLNLLIFFNLALGPNSRITGGIFAYLFENLPSFGFFRSFSRFIIIYIPIIIFLVIFLFRDFKNKYRNHILIFTIIFLIFSNKIFFSGNLGGYIISDKLPPDYVIINQKYFQNTESQYNILTLPNVPYEGYTWSLANKKTDENERINQTVNFKEIFFSKPVVYNKYAVNLESRNNLFRDIFKYDLDYNFPDNFDQVVDELNIRYIIIQKDQIDILKNNILVPVGKYLYYFNNNKHYILKENNNFFSLFENSNYFPIIFPNIDFLKITDTRYIVFAKNLKKSQLLYFLQSYNKSWGLYLLPRSVDEKCKAINYFDELRVTECSSFDRKHISNYFSYFRQKPVFNSTHRLINDYANSWEVDPEYIKNNFSQEYYKENLDGSVDIVLSINFKPQKYFYIGLGISSLTLVACLGYLVYDWRRRRKLTKMLGKTSI